MSHPTPEDLRFARLAAMTDTDPDAPLDASLREAGRNDAGGEDSLRQRIAEQTQLRGACARVMDRPEHRCPSALRDQIVAAAPPQLPAPSASVIGRIGPRYWVGALAAAALIAFSTAAVVGTLQNLRPASPQAGAGVVQLVNARQAVSFDQRHRVCGSDPSTLFQRDRFPETVDGLDRRVTDAIGASLGSARLDLSDLGFSYLGAGHCVVPGPGAVHVVYRGESGHAVSLWLRSDDGSLDLEPGQLYGPPAGGPQDGRLLVWRDGDTVLYLVGDVAADLQRIQPQLAPRLAYRPV